MSLETKIQAAEADYKAARDRVTIARNASNIKECRERKGDLLVYRETSGAKEAVRLNGEDAKKVLELIEKLLDAQL